MYDIRNLNIWKKEEAVPPANLFQNAAIEELNLSVRSYNCLRRAGCQTVGDILRLIEDDENGLRKIRGLGANSENEILENIRTFKEEYSEPALQEMEGQKENLPMKNRKLLQGEQTVWNSDIENFHLSKFALSRLRQCGIRFVKDLYATDPGNEPGWYAVRELFDKISLG